MVKVRIPATSANMGPGFDCLGIALNMYNYFYVEEIKEGLELIGFEDSYKSEDNLIYSSMKTCFEKLGYKPSGIRLEIKCSVPPSRGLGSSAACIVGGIVAANEIAGGILKRDEMLEIATEIEGHPDNVAPALFGGMVISIKENEKIFYDKIKVAEGVKFCAMIPDFKLSTKDARAVLPEEISYKDGVFNAGRTALMVAALTNGSFELLKFASEDRLHQPYRGKLIPDFDKIIEKAYEFGALGTFLSGAGPTIMAMLKQNDSSFTGRMNSFADKLNNNWRMEELKMDVDGAVIVKEY